MRLVTFLLLIQMGYIIAKAIESPRSCNDSPENDPRLKRSDEKDIHFDSEDTTGKKDPGEVATRKAFSKPNNKNDNNHDITENDDENSNEFASNSNTLLQKLPLISNVRKFPANVENEDIVTYTSTTTKDTPLQGPIYYKAIDPKYLIISGLSLPKPTKIITNVSKSEVPVDIDLKETITTLLDYSNLTKAMNASNRDEANETVTKEVLINDADTDVSNIRELREHLLDHLLDYFLNIIKEENYIRNDTRKRNGKDRMKVEEKLRNYYDPHHLLFVDDDDDYYDNNVDPSDYRAGNDSEEYLLDDIKQNKEVNKENITKIYPLTLSNNEDKNTAEAHISPEDLQSEAMNLEQIVNSTSPDGESFNNNLSKPLSESEPVTSKYVNLIEKENDFSNALLNTTEKPKEAFDTNVNIITNTEISISNEALIDKAAEIDIDVLNNSEVVTDRIDYFYNNVALTVDDYTSYEDYIDSDEFEVVKNITVHESDRNRIVITTENGRRNNELDKEKYIANGTSNATYNNTKYSQIGNETTTSKDIASEREDKPNKLAILDLPNKNMNDNSQSNQDNLAENKSKNSSKNNKQALSIIFTNQIEAKTLNKTHGLKKDQKFHIISTSVNKHSDKANDSGSKNNVLMNKIVTHFDKRSDTNAEARYKYNRKYKHKDNEEAESDKSQAEQQSDDNLKSHTTITSSRIKLTSLDNTKHFLNEGPCIEDCQVNSMNRKLVAEAMAQTIAMKKVRQKGETKLEPNDESSLQNDVEIENHPTIKTVRRQKHLTVRPRKKKIRTTQANREKQLIPKTTQKRNTEDENEVCKTKHCDYKNLRSFEETSREHDEYKLKRRDKFKTASKHNNKTKVNKNKMQLKHRFIKTHRTFTSLPKENSEYEIKHRGIKKPVLSNTMSMENEMYVRKHISDFATVEEPVSKKVHPEYKPKFSHNFQKKRQLDKMLRKVKHKHDSDETYESEHERKLNSGNTLNPNDADSQTLENQEKKETLESCEELSQQNNLRNEPRLPFYVSSSTKRVKKEIFKKQPKKLGAQKNKTETELLLGDLNTVLKGKSDLKNIDFNTTINRLASSMILDFITDKVAGQMLKKLGKSLVSKNHLRRTDMSPEKVEQIDILFEKDGDMVMTGREYIREKDEDENGIKETDYPF